MVVAAAGFNRPRPPRILSTSVRMNIKILKSTQNITVQEPDNGNKMIPPKVINAVKAFSSNVHGVKTVMNINKPIADVSGRKFHTQ